MASGRRRDGSRIAVKTLGSESVTRITNGPGGDFHPVWSPDGQSIAFQRGLRTPDLVTQVCLVSGDGRRAARAALAAVERASWPRVVGRRSRLILPVRGDAHVPFHLAALDMRTLTHAAVDVAAARAAARPMPATRCPRSRPTAACSRSCARRTRAWTSYHRSRGAEAPSSGAAARRAPADVRASRRAGPRVASRPATA